MREVDITVTHKCSRESHQMGPPTIAGGLAVVSCILTTCSWSVFNRSRRGLSNPKYGLQTPRFHVSRHTETDIKTNVVHAPLHIDVHPTPHVYYLISFVFVLPVTLVV